MASRRVGGGGDGRGVEGEKVCPGCSTYVGGGDWGMGGEGRGTQVPFKMYARQGWRKLWLIIIEGLSLLPSIPPTTETNKCTHKRKGEHG